MKIVPGMQLGGYTILYQLSSTYAIAKCNNCNSIRKVHTSGLHNVKQCRICERNTTPSRTKFYTYKGQQYTIKEIAKLANSNISTIRSRLKKGYPIEEVIEGSFNKGDRLRKLYTYNGKQYTLKQLADLANCSEAAIKGRIKKSGYSIEEAIDKDFLINHSKAKLYEYKGKQYTIKELAELSGHSIIALRHRLDKGLSVKEAVEKSAGPLTKKYDYKGNKYTLEELSQLAGCTKNAFKARLNMGYSIKEAVERSFNGAEKKSKKYDYKGKQYTLRELGELAGCKATTIYARIKIGHSVEEAVEMGPAKNK